MLYVICPLLPPFATHDFLARARMRIYLNPRKSPDFSITGMPGRPIYEETY